MGKEMQKNKQWNSSQDVKYTITKKDFQSKVLMLRKKYPNDQEFGSAVAKLIKRQ
jgi:hypothetical protein